jgi:hypothetical protein
MLSRFRRRRWSAVEAPPSAAVAAVPHPVATAEPRSYLVDAHTRTFWRSGAPRSETLVEAGGGARADEVRLRVAELLELRDRPRRLRAGTGDPAYLETLMVELLRARRFDRAFALLAPECRREWGTAGAFAAAAAAGTRTIAGVEVLAVRRLDGWIDEERGRVFHDVAELDVQYHVHSAAGTLTLRRTVHQVRDRHGWRSLLFPPPLPTPETASTR